MMMMRLLQHGPNYHKKDSSWQKSRLKIPVYNYHLLIYNIIQPKCLAFKEKKLQSTIKKTKQENMTH